MSNNSNNDSRKICIEVLASNHINNLTEKVQNALLEEFDLDSLDELDSAVEEVVTGLSQKPARKVIRHAVSEGGLNVDYGSDDCQIEVYEPKVQKVLNDLDVEDYQEYSDPQNSMERDAFRRACESRAWSLVNGVGDMPASERVFVFYDDDGADKRARRFIDNILEEGGRVVPVPVEGEEPDSEAAAESSEDADEEAELEDELDGFLEADA